VPASGTRQRKPIGGLIQQLLVELQFGGIAGMCRAEMGREGGHLRLQGRPETPVRCSAPGVWILGLMAMRTPPW